MQSRPLRAFIALGLVSLMGLVRAQETDASSSDNPFLSASTLPYQAPPFDRIEDDDYEPAFAAGMQQHIIEIEAIASRTAAPTFANTIEALERSGALLTRTSKVFFALTQANTDDMLQAVESRVAPKLAAHRDAIYLDPRLFERIEAVYEQRDEWNLTPEQRYLVERHQRDFVHAGARLGEAEKTALRALNQEESTLTTEFQQRLLAANKEAAVTIADVDELAGLGAGDIAAAADTATARGEDGEWVITLQNTTQQPVLSSLEHRAVRRRVLAASMARGTHGGDSDTRAIIARLAQLRADKARLFGFATYADYALDDQMAKTPAAAIGLLTDMVPAATGKARDEVAKMQALIDAQPKAFPLAASDWSFYAEQVRKADYDLDEAEVRPYFELDRVLRDGVFFAAHELYGLTFAERRDIPVYQPDVRVFEVTDADGEPFALWYCDYFARDNKSGGAWMDSFVDQSDLLALQPVVYNVCNFTKPAPGQPALLSFDDVTTMFHEFGHALHGMLSDVRYPTLSGTNVPRDYVEFPSQFNEHWASEPRVFAHYAKHYETGEPMSADLVAKIERSRTFNQGYATTEYLAAALLDMAWHSIAPGAAVEDTAAFEAAALARFHVDLAEVPPRYRSTYFAHVWSSSYAAGYYAYLWAEVLDDDAYEWFVENGGMTRENGQRFRDMILSRGGTLDAAQMYRAFRGREPSVQPLLEQRGLSPRASK